MSVIRLLLTLLTGLVAALAAVGLSAALANSGEEIETEATTTTLEPGDNYVGWVSEPISVDDIFAGIPEAALIYSWDADRRVWRSAIRDIGGSLTALEPGMAAMIRIIGDERVEWQRPLTPAKGMVTLYRGLNWVTWVGRDNWPLDQVARGIGISLISIRVGDVTYPAPLDTSIGELPKLRRGDALQVTVSRDLRWLQPTGMMPDIVPVGDISQSLLDSMSGEIRELLDYFAETHGVETDFSDTGIVIWHTAEDAVRYQDSDPEYSFGLRGEALRVYLEHDAEGGGTGWGMHVKSSWWHPNPRRSIFKTHLTHEWFHYLQIQYTDFWKGSGVPLEWILEGTASWSGDFGIRIAEGHMSFEQTRRGYTIDAARTSVTLRSAERRNTPWQYRLGLLAIDLLVERSGKDSFVEYFRLQHPQPVDLNRRWTESPSLDEVFATAFGIELDSFYAEFAEWRGELPHRGPRYDYETGDRTLRGTLALANGDPSSGFWINTAPYIGEHKSGRIRRTHIRDGGTFSIDLAPGTTQRLWITHDDCTLWLTDDGLATTRPEASEHRLLETRNLPRLNLMIPAGVCNEASGIEVEVLRLRGDDRRIAVTLNSEDGRKWISALADGADSHAANVSERGRYRVMVRVGGCDLWYHPMGLVPAKQNGALVELYDEQVAIETRIPSELCATDVSGRLIAGGEPFSGEFRLLASSGDVFGQTFPAGDGEFVITVPDARRYTLEYEVGPCRVWYSESGATTVWQQATRISVEDEDVTGIEFRVPADPADLCR